MQERPTHGGDTLALKESDYRIRDAPASFEVSGRRRKETLNHKRPKPRHGARFDQGQPTSLGIFEGSRAAAAGSLRMSRG